MSFHLKVKVKSLLVAAAALLGSASGAADKCNSTEFEYVVVGSGPGGGPLAANLARAGHSVFLIEAGDDYGDQLVQEIPAWWIGSIASPEMSWHFYVEHFRNETQARRDNKYVYQYDNGTIYYGLDPPEDVTPLGILYPRGSSLGGSGQSNAGNFVLPPDEDWEYIARLTDDESWAPERMREHFINLEKNEYVPPGTEGHGFDGYISTIQNNLSSVLDRPGIIDIARQGLRLVDGIEVTDDEELATLLQRDNNRDDPMRFHQPTFTQNPVHVNSKRERSSARDLVAETLAARNEDGSKKYPLIVSFNSLASRVLFENKSKTRGKPKAEGVEYLFGEALYSADQRYDASAEGELRVVKASKEVIVAGGTFNTPQILKLSGIGAKEELEAHGIPVVVDLPAVGSHLHDHTESGVTLRARTNWPNDPLEGCSLGQTTNPDQDHCLAEWVNDNSGIYGEAGTPLSFTFRSSVAKTKDVDIYYFGSPGFQFVGFYPEFQTAPIEPDIIGWSVVKALGRDTPGTVELRSTNPRDTPIINFNWFEGSGGELDLQALTEGVENLLDVMDAVGEPYTPYESIQPIPGLDVTQSIADTAFSHHASSTCRIGPKDNKDYCVDSNFKVNGVHGLRVVDASVFPYTPGAYPIAAVFVISEKAFEDIMREA